MFLSISGLLLLGNNAFSGSIQQSSFQQPTSFLVSFYAYIICNDLRYIFFSSSTIIWIIIILTIETFDLGSWPVRLTYIIHKISLIIIYLDIYWSRRILCRWFYCFLFWFLLFYISFFFFQFIWFYNAFWKREWNGLLRKAENNRFHKSKIVDRELFKFCQAILLDGRIVICSRLLLIISTEWNELSKCSIIKKEEKKKKTM